MPLTYTPLVLKGLNLQDPQQLIAFQQQICDFLNAIGTAPGISGVLNGAALLSGNSFSQFSSNATITTNQTINCTNLAQVSATYTYTTAASLTISLTNLSAGTLVWLRVVNTSGSAQTFTYSATTPASVSYTVASTLSVGQAIWSSGVTVNNNAFASIMAISASAGPLLVGIGSNG